MENLPIEIQKALKKGLNKCSYGIAILTNGNTINIRKDFNRLRKMWTLYSFFTEMDLKAKESFMEMTRGVFYNGETALRYGDILALVNGEEIESNNEKGADLRDYAGVIDSALNIYSQQDGNNDDQEEEAE
jgi:nitrogenase molybdenum-iron protein alpha/beta subunit